MPLNLITVSGYRLENKEGYNIILVKRSTFFTFYNKSVVTCYHVILSSTKYLVHVCISHYVFNEAPNTWAEKIYFGHKILMKPSHDCSY